MSLLQRLNVKIGHAHDERVKTGVTVILPDAPAICGVDIRGGGPGTREISALNNGGLITHIHGICLSGGSVYGLAAADAVTQYLGTHNRGFVAREGIPVSPIVPAAILFDNANGGDKNWNTASPSGQPPFYGLGQMACRAADYREDEGAIGAGYGATAGLYRGGLGLAHETVNGTDIMAVIAANPVGSPYMPDTRCFWAWPYERDNEFGGQRPPADYRAGLARDTKLDMLKAAQNPAGQSTVIGAVITNAALGPSQAKRMAIMAQDGLAMSVQPSHTPLDGDTIFALSVGKQSCDTPIALSELGAAAARCVARALSRGVYVAGQI